MNSNTALRPEYEAWLERVRATYVAVGYTCGHRLNDRELGDRVSAAVVAGLLSRPRVFRYQGLPYSGRIAALAEGLIQEAREGRLVHDHDWHQLRSALLAVSPDIQQVFVLLCVQGRDAEEMASVLGCDVVMAKSLCADALRVMRDIVQSSLVKIADDAKS